MFIEYQPMIRGSDYVEPKVKLEFGARSTGEPAVLRSIVCDAAEHVPGVVFPTAEPRVMSAERTFWEKATAIHVYCAREKHRGRDGFARHWHDVVRLDDYGIADRAIADRPLAHAVAEHKSMFFREKSSDGSDVDYRAVVAGSLRLVPSATAAETLRADYLRMVADDWFAEDAESFDELMDRCRTLEDKVNHGAPTRP